MFVGTWRILRGKNKRDCKSILSLTAVNSPLPIVITLSISSDGYSFCVTEPASKKVRVYQQQNTYDSLAHSLLAEILSVQRNREGPDPKPNSRFKSLSDAQKVPN